MSNPFGERRTRSKFPIADFDFSLQESPLKNAKKNSRQQHMQSQSSLQPSQSTEDTPATGKGGGDMDVAEEDTDDELLLSPSKRNKHGVPSVVRGSSSGVKRPSSPSRDDNASGSQPQSPCIRHSKRARRDLETLGETGNFKSRDATRPPRASSEPRLNLASRHKRKRSGTPSSPTKPRSFASTSSHAQPQVQMKGRASSVPLFPNPSNLAIPHFDFNNLPPSPRRARSRSPSKERLPKLRIVSNPLPPPERLEPIQDETLMDVDSLLVTCLEPTLPPRPRDSSPLSGVTSPVTPPPATSSPDLVPPGHNEVDKEENTTDIATSKASPPEAEPLSPLTPALSSPLSPLSPISPILPLPGETAHIQTNTTPLISTQETPNPVPHPPAKELKGKSRLPRPPSNADLASKVKQADSQSAKPSRGPTSGGKAVLSKGKGKEPAFAAAGSSKSATMTQGSSTERNVFTVLMGAAKSQAAFDQRKTKGRPTQASTSKTQQDRRQTLLKTNSQVNSVPEKPKASMKSKMRPRAKPKPVLLVPASLLPPEEEEEEEEGLAEGSSPHPISLVDEIPLVQPSSREPQSDVEVSKSIGRTATPQLPGLFTPEATPALSNSFTPPPGEMDERGEGDLITEPDANQTTDVVMTSPPKDRSEEPPLDISTTIEPLSPLSEVEHALPEAEMTAPLELPPSELPAPSQSTEAIATSPASQPVLDDPAQSQVAEQLSTTPKKRKRGGPSRRAMPDSSPRRVTRSVSQQQKAELHTNPVQPPSETPRKAEGVDHSAEPTDSNEDTTVFVVPSSPSKSPRRSRRSMGSKGTAPSRIPVPITPARIKGLSSPAKSAQSSPSRLTRSVSMQLPRLDGVAGPSSLSNLSNALDKLRMPPPSRPNTSLGFNRDVDDDDEEADKYRFADDTAIRRPTVPLQRAASMDSNVLANGGASTSKKSTTLVQKPMTSFFTSQSGSKPTNGSRLLPSNAAPRVGPRVFAFGRGRAAPRASKKTTLPSVMHSPVKGGGDSGDGDGDDEDIEVSEVTHRSQAEASYVFTAPLPLVPREDVDDDGADSEQNPKGKEPKRDDTWRKNATRRASLALQGLSQSLSSLPQASEPTLMGPPATPRGTRTCSSSYPSTGASEDPRGEGDAAQEATPPGRVTRSSAAKTAPGALGKIHAGSGGHVSSSRKATEPEASEALDVLEDCTVFLDVRTDEGEDAGGLFLEMLQRLGARILSRVGVTCTHIVYKNGLNSTVSRWRKLKNKPSVVGIAWVVECAEQRQRVDETPHLIDLENVNVAGIVKRRRSMLPRFIARELEGDDSLQQSGQGEENANVVANESTGSITLEDDLPPLEIIRRRTLGAAS